MLVYRNRVTDNGLITNHNNSNVRFLLMIIFSNIRKLVFSNSLVARSSSFCLTKRYQTTVRVFVYNSYPPSLSLRLSLSYTPELIVYSFFFNSLCFFLNICRIWNVRINLPANQFVYNPKSRVHKAKNNKKWTWRLSYNAIKRWPAKSSYCMLMISRFINLKAAVFCWLMRNFKPRVLNDRVVGFFFHVLILFYIFLIMKCEELPHIRRKNSFLSGVRIITCKCYSAITTVRY